MTSPPAPVGWNQPEFVEDGGWRGGSRVWWDIWTWPQWRPLPPAASPIGLLDALGTPECADGVTQLYRRKLTLTPPEAGMEVTRAVLEMWSDNKTEWWWQGASIAYNGEGYVGKVEPFPTRVASNGGTYLLAIQNSNDHTSQAGCNPQGTAWVLRVTWAPSSATLTSGSRAHPGER